MAMIEVRDLKFSYNDVDETIKGISFDVEEGTYTTLIGHNGSGKSTVAKLLAGLLEKKSGVIRINGMDLTLENLNKIRSCMGIVFQNPDNQFIGSTVRDDIAFGLENHCVPQPEMDGIIEANAAKVGMTDKLDREPSHLSGGQKQRVAIAGVLAMKPKLLIFDEATSMLDPQGKDEIKKVIKEIHRESGLTILSITHDIDEVAGSDRVIALEKGRIVLSGTPHEVFEDTERLKKIRLDVPFAIRLRDELQKLGVDVGTHLTMEGMAEELCQLHSNM